MEQLFVDGWLQQVLRVPVKLDVLPLYVQDFTVQQIKHKTASNVLHDNRGREESLSRLYLLLRCLDVGQCSEN